MIANAHPATADTAKLEIAPNEIVGSTTRSSTPMTNALEGHGTAHSQ